MYENKTEVYFRGERPELQRHFPETRGPVLDIGCGSGGFGAYLKQRFGPETEVWGVEPEAAPAERAAGHLNRVLCMPAEQAVSQLPDGHFDVIVFNDSLEHMIDPGTVLRMMSAKLRPGGRVFACIPNVRYYRVLFDLFVRKDWVYQDEGVLDHTHLRFFTRAGVSRLFNESGYEVREMQGVRCVLKRHRKRLKWLQRLSFGLFADIAFMQYICVATIRADESRAEEPV